MPFLSVDLDALKRDVDELSAQNNAYRVEVERIRGLLDCFDNPAFETFRQKVLLPEMQRLANLRMEVASDQVATHERIMGQWAEAKMLCEKKDKLMQDLILANIQVQEGGIEFAKAEGKYRRELNKREGK